MVHLLTALLITITAQTVSSDVNCREISALEQALLISRKELCLNTSSLIEQFTVPCKQMTQDITKRIDAIQFSPDNSKIIVRENASGSITCLDRYTGKVFYELLLYPGNQKKIVISPDSRLATLLLKEESPDLGYVWELATGRKIATVPRTRNDENKEIQALALTNNGRYVVYSLTDGQQTRIKDLMRNEERSLAAEAITIKNFGGHMLAKTESNILVTVPPTIHTDMFLFDPAQGEIKKFIQDTSHMIRNVCAKLYATRSAIEPHLITIYNLTDHAEVCSLGEEPNDQTCFCFNHDGTQFLTNSRRGIVHCWSIPPNGGVPTKRDIQLPTTQVIAEYRGLGTYFVGSENAIVCFTRNRIIMYNQYDDAWNTLITHRNSHPYHLRAISPDGTTIAVVKHSLPHSAGASSKLIFHDILEILQKNKATERQQPEKSFNSYTLNFATGEAPL